jgi:hypothetical protein
LLLASGAARAEAPTTPACIGPARAGDAKTEVIRFGYSRETRTGDASITIYLSDPATVRAVMRELRPAADACLADLP